MTSHFSAVRGLVHLSIMISSLLSPDPTSSAKDCICCPALATCVVAEALYVLMCLPFLVLPTNESMYEIIYIQSLSRTRLMTQNYPHAHTHTTSVYCMLTQADKNTPKHAQSQSKKMTGEEKGVRCH